jgi:hypothetical protein
MSTGEAKAAWAGLRDELVEIQVEGKPAWLLAAYAKDRREPAPAEHTVRLLPAFDTYLLGYADREFAVPKPYQKHIFHGGQVVPTLIVDGLAAGTWRYEQRGGLMRIAVTPFGKLNRDVRELIAEEAEDVGRFYGMKATLV